VTLHDCSTCPAHPNKSLEGVDTLLLKFRHGLGDATLFTTVLTHLHHAYPRLGLVVEAEESRQEIFQGLDFLQECRTAGQPTGQPTGQPVEVQWRECEESYQKWPSTKTSRCLREEFGLEPRADLLRYRMEVPPDALSAAEKALRTLPASRKGVVAIHARGTASAGDKDLPDHVVAQLCIALADHGFVPLLLDFSEQPSLVDQQVIHCFGRGHWLWEGHDWAPPERLAALLALTSLNVVIDSGPGKLALTQATPCITVWTKCHPVHYVDCPPNDHALHLVPRRHAEHIRGDRRTGMAWFKAHFRHRIYDDLSHVLCEAALAELGLAERVVISPEPRKVPPPKSAQETRQETRNSISCFLTPLILRNHLSAGDVLVMTAAVESLHQARPDRYQIAVDVSTPALYEHNPLVWRPEGEDARRIRVAGEELSRKHDADKEAEVQVELTDGRKARYLQMHYPLINECNQRAVHMMQGYCDYLASRLGHPVPLLVNRPIVHVTEEEKGWLPQVQEVTGKPRKYWVVNAGVKSDYTAKQWPWYQRVVDLLQGEVLFVQIGRKEHLHRPLEGVLDLLDKTDDRQLIRLIWHSQGVLCGVTYLMHLAAALSKPAVVLAGGREPRSWNTYPLQSLFSVVGQMPCCQQASCWKSRTVPLHDGKDDSLCETPAMTEPPAPACMAVISPEEVVREIRRFEKYR
jgi:ADP-heptose:LPS heptosyltransferase